jgi:hypothetical protein
MSHLSLKKPVSALIGFTLMLLAASTHAQFYEVEMTVFTNNPYYAQEQTWPKNIDVTYADNLASLTSQAAEVVYPELVQPNRPSAKPNLIPLLDPRFNKHNDHVNKLEQSGEHRVLFHQTWLQKIEGSEFTQNIIIQSGRIENNVYELGGTVSLHQTPSPNNLPPAIHIKSHLWYVQFGDNAGEPWPIPQSLTISNDGYSPLPVDKSAKLKRIAVLKATEIVTRNTLHYIDNPLFGLLIEIRPYSAIQLSE